MTAKKQALNKACPSRRAFTLLELLVVIVVIASLAMLVVGMFDTVPERAELTVARANLSTVREALIGSATAPGMLADMRSVPGFASNGFQYREWELLPLLLDNADPQLTSRQYYPNYELTTNRGWRGPYLQRQPGVQNTDSERLGLFPAGSDRRSNPIYSHYGQTGYRAIGDPWGNPIVLQIPPDAAFAAPSEAKRWRFARLVSAGPDGVLSTPRYDSSVLDTARRQTEARLAGMSLDRSTTARGDDLVLFLNRPDIYEEEP